MIENCINSNNTCFNNTSSKNIFDESKKKFEVEKMEENADQLSCQFVDSSRCVGARFLEMAARSLPNTGEFFFSLASLIENAERQLISAFYDTSEFLLRRPDEYERTLSTFLSRVGESYGSLPVLQNVMADLTYLCDRVSFLRSHFEHPTVRGICTFFGLSTFLSLHSCL